MQARPPWPVPGSESRLPAQQNKYCLALYTRVSQLLVIYIANALETAKQFCVPEACHLFEDITFMEDEREKLWKRKEYH